MFLLGASLKLITNLIIVDLVGSVTARSPPSNSHLPHDSINFLNVVFSVAPLLRHAPFVVGLAVVTGAALEATHNLAALVFVGLGLSSPTLWPDVLGHWGDAYTVRKLWGYVFWRIFRFPGH